MVKAASTDEDLSNNLYRLWNRLSSGSYFPSPVRRVDIQKDEKSTRPLGIPTVCDRIAQTVAKRYLEPIVKPLFHGDLHGYRPGGQRIKHFRSRVNVAGATTGCWISISRVSSIPSTGNSCYDRVLRAPRYLEAGSRCSSHGTGGYQESMSRSTNRTASLTTCGEN